MPARVLGAWLPVLLWAALILLLGSNSFSSVQTSRFLGPLLEWLLPNLDASVRIALLNQLRSSAHVIEYAGFAFLVFRALRLATPHSALACAALSLVLVAGLAAADEQRQAQLAHRTGSSLDVLLDSAGGAAMLGLLLVVERALGRPLWRRRDRASEAGA